MRPLAEDPFDDQPPAKSRMRLVAAPPGLALPHLELPLVAGRVLTIGRAEDNDLLLPDPNGQVAHWHCRIKNEGVWKLENCSARHGTQVNDRLLAEGEVVVLAAGDLVRIADYLLRVESDGASPLRRWGEEPVLPSPP